MNYDCDSRYNLFHNPFRLIIFKAAIFYVDSSGTKSYLIPISSVERSIIDPIYPDGFRCCFECTDQQAAIMHYNNVVRVQV